MTKFSSRITLPEDISSFFDKLNEQGEAKFTPGDRYLTYIVEEDDLWDAATTIQETIREIAASGVYRYAQIDFTKAVEVK